MRGMTETLKPELLSFFVKQGWQPALLMHLFFEAIEVVDDKGVVDRLVNDLSHKDFPRFKEFVEATARCDLVVGQEAGDPVYFSSTAARISPEEAARAKKADLVVISVSESGEPEKDESKNTRYRLASKGTETVFRLVAKPPNTPGKDSSCAEGPLIIEGSIALSDAKKAASSEGTPRKGQQVEALRDSGSQRHAASSKSQRNTQGNAASETKYKTQFVLRSPQSMIYYLGELARFQNGNWENKDQNPRTEKPLTIPLGGPDRRAVLFQMSNQPVASPAVSVEYAGQTFSVPRFSGNPTLGQEDRSVSVLSLMTLIVGLQDKGTTAPSVSNVRLLR